MALCVHQRISSLNVDLEGHHVLRNRFNKKDLKIVLMKQFSGNFSKDIKQSL